MERPILYNLSELNHEKCVPNWDILGFFREKNGAVWVEFSYCGKVHREQCLKIPEVMDRYCVILSEEEAREFGIESGIEYGFATFDVTPIPGDNSGIPLPPVRDLSV